MVYIDSFTDIFAAERLFAGYEVVSLNAISGLTNHR
jgi:hypothetical protein